MKSILSLLIVCVCFGPILSQADTSIVDLKIAYNETTVPPQYEVYLKSDNDVDSMQYGSCQITVVFPESAPDNIFENSNISSVYPNTWTINQVINAPMANDSFDYYAVTILTGGNVNTDFLTAGVEVLLFTFSIDGDCIEGIRLFDNMRDPLSMFPGTSTPWMDGGLDFENNINLQYLVDGMGNLVEAYDYLYGDLEPDCLVPVEFLSFNAKKGDGMVNLSWVTATEINNDYFEVQRSVDGGNFRTIGRVDGKGTTFSTSSYVFDDKAPVEINYYRLRQVDFDGTVDYSDIRFVEFDSESGEVVKYDVYPNPFVSELTLDLGDRDLYRIELFNSAGQAIIQQTHVSGQVLKLNEIQPGTYTLKVYDSIGNEILVKTVVKVERS